MVKSLLSMQTYEMSSVEMVPPQQLERKIEYCLQDG